MKPLVEKKLIVERDVKRIAFLIHEYESERRSRASVMNVAKKRKSIITFGENYGVMVGAYSFNLNGNEKIKVTVLLKRYDSYKGNRFFFGDSSVTLNVTELTELFSYAERIFQHQGINVVVEQPSDERLDDDTDDEDVDIDVVDDIRRRGAGGVAGDERRGKKEEGKGRKGRKDGWKKVVKGGEKRRIVSSSDEDDDDNDDYSDNDDRGAVRKAKSKRRETTTRSHSRNRYGGKNGGTDNDDDHH